MRRATVVTVCTLCGQIPTTRDDHRRARRQHTKQLRHRWKLLDGPEPLANRTNLSMRNETCRADGGRKQVHTTGTISQGWRNLRGRPDRGSLTLPVTSNAPRSLAPRAPRIHSCTVRSVRTQYTHQLNWKTLRRSTNVYSALADDGLLTPDYEQNDRVQRRYRRPEHSTHASAFPYQLHAYLAILATHQS